MCGGTASSGVPRLVASWLASPIGALISADYCVNDYQLPLIIDVINDPVIADANAPRGGLTHNLARARRSRIIRKSLYPRQKSRLGGNGQPSVATLPRRSELNSIGHELRFQPELAKECASLNAPLSLVLLP